MVKNENMSEVVVTNVWSSIEKFVCVVGVPEETNSIQYPGIQTKNQTEQCSQITICKRKKDHTVGAQQISWSVDFIYQQNNVKDYLH